MLNCMQSFKTHIKNYWLTEMFVHNTEQNKLNTSSPYKKIYIVLV